MRLFLDHQISRRVAEALQAQGYDVTTAAREGVAEADDETVWNTAIALGCVVVTYNYRDFLQLFDQSWTEGKSHPGLVIVFPTVIRHSDLGGQIRALSALMDANPDLTDTQHYLQPAEPQ